MGDQSFAEKEFRCITRELEKGKYDLALLLRVGNFKRQTPITWKEQEEQSWDGVLKAVNDAINEAKDVKDEGAVCASLKKLDGIYGIGVPTASVLLAASDPARFAIIDERMFIFFQDADACKKLKLVFKDDKVPEAEFDNSDELTNWLRWTREGFEFSKSTWGKIYEQDGQKPCAYSCYLKALSAILRIVQKHNKQDFADLRSVELKIWKWREDNPNSAP
jgi:hypothetical protein